MILSASYKTDIPAFYGEWFMNRLRAGSCKMINPYGRQVYRISLHPQDVDGFVFWTKNGGPFLAHLPEIHERGYPFYFQYSITGYPKTLESAVVQSERAIEQMRQIAACYGPRAAVWRYDPILCTSLTPPDFHRANFERLARALSGSTDEVVISFAQIYKKTQRNLDAVGTRAGFTWADPPAEVKLGLARDLVQIADAYGMRLTTCSQSAYCVSGAGEARCVDAGRMSDVAGRPVAAKEQGNRPDCRCSQSKDIGEYDTCLQGCTYCYAVQSQELATHRHRNHDPEGEYLFPPAAGRQS